ncbi:MAG: helix-turn-helix transcriptional regulator, partial [Burkholderiaceae bacterium]
MNQPLLNRAETELEPVLDKRSGIGPTLKGLREAKQLSLNEVSTRLKFSTRQIEALESEQWDRLPTGVSLRGFVKNYGRYLD